MCLDDGSLVVLNGWTPPTTGGRRAKEGGWRGRFVFSFSRLVFFCDISGEYPGDSPEMEYQSCREVDIWWYLILTYYILYIYCTWWYDVIEPFGLPLELIWFCEDRSEGINRSHTLWQFHIIMVQHGQIYYFDWVIFKSTLLVITRGSIQWSRPVSRVSIPSGYVKIAITKPWPSQVQSKEWMFSYGKWWIFPVRYVNVYQRVDEGAAWRAFGPLPCQELSLKPLGDKVLGDLGISFWVLKVLRHWDVEHEGSIFSSAEDPEVLLCSRFLRLKLVMSMSDL